MFRIFLWVSVICALCSSRHQDQASRDEAQSPAAAGVAQPWVLHAPFDEFPHAVLIAVQPRLFVAYDADTCGFRCAWSGEVAFGDDKRANAAGPTPKRRGAVESEGVDGVPWETCKKGVLTPCKAHYRGCTFESDRVTLCFELTVQGEARPIRVEETPTVLTPAEMDELWSAWNQQTSKWRDESGRLRMLRRSFRVLDLPPGIELSLRYWRTVKSITGWPGFDGRRDPRAGEFETKNCLLVEPELLAFTNSTEAQTLEMIELDE